MPGTIGLTMQVGVSRSSRIVSMTVRRIAMADDTATVPMTVMPTVVRHPSISEASLNVSPPLSLA